MNRLMTFPAVTLLLLASGCSGKMDWQEFSDAKGKFSVEMPGKPKTETKSVAGHTLMAFPVEVRNAGYVASYVDFPPGTPYDYDGGINGIAAQYNGTVTSKKDFTLDGVTGKEYEMSITKPKSGYAMGRILYVQNRLYQVLVVGSSVRVADADVQRFLTSFKLTK